MYPGRGKATLDAFYKKLGKKSCAKIEAVASDGARGFLSSTKKHLKDAVIVLDHFHIKKYLNDAVDTIRKEELRKARQQEQEELSKVLHCNKRFILMQNTVSDKKRDLLEKLSSLNERVYKAMLLKEQFLAIYQTGDRKAAYANLRQWIVAAVKSGLPSFVELGYKPFSITKQMVWEAYLRVKANKGAAGIDDVSITKFEEKLKDLDCCIGSEGQSRKS